MAMMTLSITKTIFLKLIPQKNKKNK